MAFDKKTSVYSDHGTIGPAEELDTYGVWVKSEPQDLAAGMSETANFDADAIPYEADFDGEFGNLGLSESDFADFGDEPVADDIENDGFAASSFADSDFNDGSFDDDMAAVERGTEEASTQFLMKIAGELSTIRSELNTLKREFADIRAEGGKTEVSSGAFTEKEDEKIALTGDEMENFLASADFSPEEDLSLDSGQESDPQREADEAALKELSQQNELSADSGADEPQEPVENIEIDFDNLGIDLAEGLEVEPEPELEDAALHEALPEDFEPAADEAEAALAAADAPLEDTLPETAAEDTAGDDDFGALSFDSLSFDSDDLGVAAVGEDSPLEDEVQETGLTDEDFEELAPLDPEEDKELHSIRLEGAIPHTPAPDNSHYLENDPFVLENSDFDSIPDENTLTDEAGVGETVTEEPAEEPAPEEASEEISIEETTTQETTTEETTTEEVSTGETAAESAVQEEALSDDTLSFEDSDSSFDALNFDTDLDDGDFSLESPAAPQEAVLQEAAPEEAEAIAPLEEEPAAVAESADIAPLEEEPPEPEASEPEASAEPIEEQPFDIATDDFSGAVIDEPDLSAGIVDPPLEEPALADLSFDDDVSFDDVSFDMDDFGETLEVGEAAAADADATADAAEPAQAVEAEPAAADEELVAAVPAIDDSAAIADLDSPDDFALDADLDSGELDMGDFGDDADSGEPDRSLKVSAVSDIKPDKAESKPVSRDDDAISMDQIIPEGFEINAQEAAISSDDLEAALPEEELPGAGEETPLSDTPLAPVPQAGADGDVSITPALKTELKSVLSYMDHLLESLPEDKIEEFAKSEYFDSYKKIFKELGLV